MAHLTSRQREGLPDSAFALPELRRGGHGGLPLTNARGGLDRKHIGSAAARLSMMRNRGSISSSQYYRGRRRIEKAGRAVGMYGAQENPAGDFVHDHPWMTFFLGLAALNTVGWLAFLAIAAAAGKSAGGSAPSYSAGSVIPIPEGSAPTVKIGDSLLLIRAGSPTEGTTSNSSVLAPAPGVSGGFVALAAGSATLTSAATGATTTVTVVASGTAGVSGPPKIQRPPFPFLPKLLRVA